MAPSNYKVIFFDVGGTLAWAEPSFAEVWAQALEEHGYRVSAKELIEKTGTQGPEFNRSDLIRAFRAADEDLKGPLPRNLREQEAFFRRYDAAVLQRLGLPADGQILDTVQRHFKEDIVTHVFEDARPTLARLRSKGFRLGIISNATHDLPERLEAVDLAQHFGSITYSYAVGVEKPHPDIFRAALAVEGVRPSEAVHVGDSPGADVRGASAVGMKAMLIDRRGTHPDAEGIVLESLGEISARL